MGKQTEHCGRCAMSSVVGVTGDGDGDDETSTDRDPFGTARIEVDDADLRKLSPGAWLGGVKRRLDDVATQLTYGR